MKSKPPLYSETHAGPRLNAVPVSDVDPTVFENVLHHLDLCGITSAAFDAAMPVLCDPEKKSLYFSMRGSEPNDVGHKELIRNANNGLVETITSPESNSYGVITFAPSTKRSIKDAKTAIVVLTLRDALALRMEKNNGKSTG